MIDVFCIDMYREIVPFKVVRRVDIEVEGVYGPYMDDIGVVIINGIVVEVHEDMATLEEVKRFSERKWQVNKRGSVHQQMFFLT